MIGKIAHIYSAARSFMVGVVFGGWMEIVPWLAHDKESSWMVLLGLGCSRDEDSLHVDMNLHENRFIGCNEEKLKGEIGDPKVSQDNNLVDGWIYFARQKKLYIGKNAMVREQAFQSVEGKLFVWLYATNRIWRVVYDVTVPDGVSL